MADRQQVEFKFRVKDRIITVRATDSVGPEDVYETQFNAVLHRYVTNEDVVQPAGRDVKDWIIRGNLVI